jgi:FkbM family methyltransferase
MRHRLLTIINALLSRFDFTLSRRPRQLTVSPAANLELGIRHAIAAQVVDSIRRGEKFVFLQIGAHEGWGDDEPATLSELCVERLGILVEPQPHVVHRLRQRFENTPDLHVIECAIGPTPGTLTFFYVDNADGALPKWVEQVGSFNREHVRRMEKQVPQIAVRTREIPVAVQTPREICTDFGIVRLDLLMVDTEGADWAIVQAFPMESIRPRLVIAEHAHLSRSDRRSLVNFLLAHRYRVAVLDRDIIAERI